MMIDFEDHSEDSRDALLAYLAGENSTDRIMWRDWLAAAASFGYVFLVTLAAVYFLCGH